MCLCLVLHDGGNLSEPVISSSESSSPLIVSNSQVLLNPHLPLSRHLEVSCEGEALYSHPVPQLYLFLRSANFTGTSQAHTQLSVKTVAHISTIQIHVCVCVNVISFERFDTIHLPPYSVV